VGRPSTIETTDCGDYIESPYKSGKPCLTSKGGYALFVVTTTLGVKIGTQTTATALEKYAAFSAEAATPESVSFVKAKKL
jgi:hypothetical protein